MRRPFLISVVRFSCHLWTRKRSGIGRIASHPTPQPPSGGGGFSLFAVFRSVFRPILFVPALSLRPPGVAGLRTIAQNLHILSKDGKVFLSGTARKNFSSRVPLRASLLRCRTCAAAILPATKVGAAHFDNCITGTNKIRRNT